MRYINVVIIIAKAGGDSTVPSRPLTSDEIIQVLKAMLKILPFLAHT